jgi:hypothetical protein
MHNTAAPLRTVILKLIFFLWKIYYLMDLAKKFRFMLQITKFNLKKNVPYIEKDRTIKFKNSFEAIFFS